MKFDPHLRPHPRRTPGCHDIIALQEGGRGHAVEIRGIDLFGFRLTEGADVEAIAAAVAEAGGTVMDKGYFTSDEPYVFAKDLDGYIIELWHEP